MAALLESYSTSWQEIVKFALKLTGERLLEEYTVGGYLFGYEDRTLKELRKLCDKIGLVNCSIIDDHVGLFIQVRRP